MEHLRFENWSAREKFISLLIAIFNVAVFAYLPYGPDGSGQDYTRAIRNLVIAPEELVELFGVPWVFQPAWLIPLMSPFATMPAKAGFVVWSMFSLAFLLFATHVLGGKPILMLITSQAWWVVYWGQMDAWPILGIAIGWLGVQRKEWLLTFIGIALCAIKPQVGFFPAVVIWWMGGDWRDRIKTVIGLLALVGVTMLIWGNWPQLALWSIQNEFLDVPDQIRYAYIDTGIGLPALPLIIPALLVPLSKEKRLIAFTATGLLISPYTPYYSTLVLLTFNIPIWGYIMSIAGWLALFPIIGAGTVWPAMVFLSSGVLIWVYYPFVREKWLAFSNKDQPETGPDANQNP